MMQIKGKIKINTLSRNSFLRCVMCTRSARKLKLVFLQTQPSDQDFLAYSRGRTGIKIWRVLRGQSLQTMLRRPARISRREIFLFDVSAESAVSGTGKTFLFARRTRQSTRATLFGLAQAISPGLFVIKLGDLHQSARRAKHTLFYSGACAICVFWRTPAPDRAFL